MNKKQYNDTQETERVHTSNRIVIYEKWNRDIRETDDDTRKTEKVYTRNKIGIYDKQ